VHPEPDLGSRSDEELLVASGRDTEAFGLLYDRTIGDVLAWFARRTADGHVAADLAAETFAAAFVSRRRFAPRGDGTARAWLFGVARHQLGRYARRERVSQKYRRRLGMPLTAVDDAAAERIEARADLEAMRRELVLALAQLPEGQREAVRLRIVDELPYAQVAARLGCSEGAARVRVTRGLAQLAEVLGP
jgi:RNA polymerase sigma-70 factor (ECF subfamily)